MLNFATAKDLLFIIRSNKRQYFKVATQHGGFDVISKRSILATCILPVFSYNLLAAVLVIS